MDECDKLLIQIARCELIRTAFTDTSHSCSKIVHLQAIARFQLPEPWSGRIETAPILFISSNPSITEMEYYPDEDWDDEDIVDFFRNRFTDSDGPAAGLKSLLSNRKSRTRVIHYWAHARARSREIIGHVNVRPGKDFALTEIVHCKSRGEAGVREARECCAGRYLAQILAIAAAPIFVVYGKHAENTICEKLKIEMLSTNLGKSEVKNRIRLIAFLPAPNSFGGPKSLAGNLSESGIIQIRNHLLQSGFR